jgi:hypothetical protein
MTMFQSAGDKQKRKCREITLSHASHYADRLLAVNGFEISAHLSLHLNMSSQLHTLNSDEQEYECGFGNTGK